MPRFKNDRSGSIINVDEMTADNLGLGWTSLDLASGEEGLDLAEASEVQGELSSENADESDGLESSLGYVAEDPEPVTKRRRSSSSASE